MIFYLDILFWWLCFDEIWYTWLAGAYLLLAYPMPRFEANNPVVAILRHSFIFLLIPFFSFPFPFLSLPLVYLFSFIAIHCKIITNLQKCFDEIKTKYQFESICLCLVYRLFHLFFLILSNFSNFQFSPSLYIYIYIYICMYIYEYIYCELFSHTHIILICR